MLYCQDLPENVQFYRESGEVEVYQSFMAPVHCSAGPLQYAKM